jgi:hypothetical protein
MVVKIFTMVKNEADIVRDWIIYHGSIFGFNNIHVIDNYSTDGTYEIINDEFGNLINYSREPNYRRKGELMTELMNNHCTNSHDYAFPIDIDEFIVYYDKFDNNFSVSVDKNLILSHINNLPPSRVYKANYINPIFTDENGYNRATVEIDYGSYDDRGGFAKSFVNKQYFNDSFDHGNHLNTNDYHLTNICLLHYQYRNLNQVKEKTYNNIIGLGYHNNLEYLRNEIDRNACCEGHHHVSIQIDILNNNYTFPVLNINDFPDKIDITPFKNRILSGYF